MSNCKEYFRILEIMLNKMEKNKLTVEEVLDEDEILQVIKIYQNTQFIPFFNELIKKLIGIQFMMVECQ